MHRWYGTLLVLLMVMAAMPGPNTAGGQGTPTPTLESIYLYCDEARDPSLFPGRFVGPMEGDYIPLLPTGGNTCWAHIGHNHYPVALDRDYRLYGGVGAAVSVEQHGFSPAKQEPQLHSGDDGVFLDTYLPIEISMNGVNWTEVARADFHLVSYDNEYQDDEIRHVLENLCDNTGDCHINSNGDFSCISLPGQCQPTNWRQRVVFDFTANGEPFKFIRIRNAESIYTGLSGFLDFSVMTLQVEDKGLDPTPTLQKHTNLKLSCDKHIMEAIIAEHPCTFGGYVQEQDGESRFVRIGNTPGQWDSASFFHTYPLDEARLDRIAGKVVVRDYRTDGTPPSKAIWLQTSDNGINWTTIHNFSVSLRPGEFWTYEGSFNVTGLNNTTASFVRLASLHMPTWFDSFAQRHPWAYFLESELELDGHLSKSMFPKK